MSSLTSPGLIKAANEALVKIQPDINMVKLFAYDFSDDFAGYGFTVKVPVIDGGTVAEFDIDSNDYEHQSGTVTYAPIQLDTQLKTTFEFTGYDVLEAPNAPYWNKCAEAGAIAISRGISEYIGGMIDATSADLSANAAVLSGDLTKAKLAKLRGLCKGRKGDTILALSPDYYNEMLALFDANVYGGTQAVQDGMVEGLYGFKAVVELNDLPDGTVGALIPTNSIAVASRQVAVGDESIYSEIGGATDENGFTITVMRHGSAAKGKGFMNVTTMFGAALVQADKIVALKNA